VGFLAAALLVVLCFVAGVADFDCAGAFSGLDGVCAAGGEGCWASARERVLLGSPHETPSAISHHHL